MSSFEDSRLLSFVVIVVFRRRLTLTLQGLTANSTSLDQATIAVLRLFVTTIGQPRPSSPNADGPVDTGVGRGTLRADVAPTCYH
jgi:hypothetical protein